MKHFLYRAKYRFGRHLNLTKPVDISLELSSFCNMHCSYCLDPKTPVLTAGLEWKPIDSISVGDKIVAFDELNLGNKSNRKMRIGEVEKIWNVTKPVLRITTDMGAIVCSLDHKFLMKNGRWRESKKIKKNDEISFGQQPWQSFDYLSNDYINGYLEAMTIGDGTARWNPLPGSTGKENDSRRQIWWRVAVTDTEIIERILVYFSKIGINNHGIKSFSKNKESNRDIFKIELRSKEELDKLHGFIYPEKTLISDDYCAGYLAGIFDAEGTALHGVIRISQKQDNDVCEKSIEYLKRFGFDSVKEKDGIRILGGKWEMLRFFGTFQPTIKRQINTWQDKGIRHKKARVLKIEELESQPLIDIQTSTRTFYGAGFATHNCYHADKKNLPFKQNFMSKEIAFEILRQGADLGVNSVKTNWRGESTMNPNFLAILRYAQTLAKGSTYIERLTNSNFKFDRNRDDIFEGLNCQTKVKISYDSFDPKVFHAQRSGGDHEITTSNIDRFYHWPNRKAEMVIQAVRTQLNKDEDIEGLMHKRWPSATVSIRDVVGGRKKDDISNLIVNDRDATERQSCLQAHVRLIFDTNGRASPCCPDIKNDLVLGDITKMSMKEIFNSRRAQNLRKMLNNKTAFTALSTCKNCSSLETFKGFKPSWNS